MAGPYQFPATDASKRVNLRKNLSLVAAVETLARDKGATASQVALAWVLAQGDDIVPIPGTKRRPYLEQNLRALELELTTDDLARLESLFAPHATAGDRYPAQAMQAVNR